MNIFALDYSPRLAAQYHNDRHVTKMILETAQLLCTVRHAHGDDAPYRATHKNHPCTIWAGETMENYIWLCHLGIYLTEEKEYRTGRGHKSGGIIRDCLENAPELKFGGLTAFSQSFGEYESLRHDNPVFGYREYYRQSKKFDRRGNRMDVWTKREQPWWWNER